MIKNIMKRQVFSYSWVFEQFLFCFIFEKISCSLPILFVHIVKSLNENPRSSRLQMFFKISVLKNLSMFAKNTCVRVLSLFNKAGDLKACIFIKKEISTQVFSCECWEIFKSSFLVEHFLFIILLCDDRILWTALGTKLACFRIVVLLLCFPSYRESIIFSYLFLYKNL